MQSSRIVRRSALALAALALVSGLSACGSDDGATEAAQAGGVDKAALISKLKAEPDYEGVPDSALDCLAGVFLKYGDEGGIQAYVDGKDKLDKIQAFGASETQAKTEAAKCAS